MRMKSKFTIQRWKHLLIFVSVILFSGNMFAQTKHIIEVTKNVFTPDNLKINPGDTVEWRNTDGFHNVNGTMATYPMNPESFGNSAGTDWTYSHVFSMPGNYDYQCDPHVDLGMIGKIEVTSGATKHIVEVTKNVFTPDDLKINVGDTVEWRNTDGFHNVNGTMATYPMNPESFGNSTGTDWTYSHVFSMPGNYDYQCDPHVALGMIGKIEVTGDDDPLKMLTINFMGMNPHIGQELWLAVIDKSSGMEIGRVKKMVEQDFMVHVPGIKPGMSYNVDFFADHNGNGMYDTPPVDHAWRMDLDNVMGDTTLNFSHNTNFTDINLSTGIEEDLGENNLSVYPNPASQKVFVSLNNVNESDFTVHIYNLAGKQLVHSKLKNTNSPVEFDISEFESGLYFMRIETLQNSDIVKFVKQ
jgi:plastocyanin